MDKVVVVTASTGLPVSVDTVKHYMRVTTEDDDQAISDMVAAATEYIEGLTGRTTIKTSYRYESDVWPSGREVELPRSPLIAHSTATPITVSYIVQGSTAVTTIGSTRYLVDTGSEPGRIVLKNAQNWPTSQLQAASGFRVAFDAGYASSTGVPLRMKHAVMVRTKQLYDGREDGEAYDELQRALDSLVWNSKVPSVP